MGKKYRDNSSIVEMQFDMVVWVGGVELLLESLDGWVNPRGSTCEDTLDYSSDKVAPKPHADWAREVSNANRPFHPVFPDVQTR